MLAFNLVEIEKYVEMMMMNDDNNDSMIFFFFVVWLLRAYF